MLVTATVTADHATTDAARPGASRSASSRTTITASGGTITTDHKK
ncbi:hypothetical protein GCM10010443_74610 [Actinoplanes cyaneus]